MSSAHVSGSAAAVGAAGASHGPQTHPSGTKPAPPPPAARDAASAAVIQTQPPKEVLYEYFDRVEFSARAEKEHCSDDLAPAEKSTHASNVAWGLKQATRTIEEAR